MEFALFLICFVVFFLIGMPIGFTMLFATWVYAITAGMDLSFLSLEMFASLDSFVLVAIPMFILTAEIMNVSTIADRLFKFCNSIVGFVPGGLGHVNVVSSIIFSGMSGSAAADAGGIGLLSYRSMVDRGFDKPFSAAVSAASACIGPIIPPSIPMVIYAMVANASIGGLFLGGIIPGLLMGAGMMVVVHFISVKRGYPKEEKFSFRVMVSSLISGFLPLMTPIILLGVITLGIATVSEAAVIAVLYSCILGFILYRSLNAKEFVACLKRVFISSGAILILFPASKLFGYVLTVEQIPLLFTDFFLNFSENAAVFLLMVNVLFLILGCFSDPIVNIMLFVPIVLPMMVEMNIDPVHFGVMIVFNTMVGLITPPVGGMLFITSAVTKVSVEDMVKEMWPHIGILIFVLLLITYIPEIVLFLPNLLLK